MPEESMWTKAAKRLNEDMTSLAAKMAPGMSPGPNMRPATPKRERADYWLRAITPDEEQMLWQEAIGTGIAEGLTHEDAVIRALPRIAISVYPARAVLLNQGERDRSITGAHWVNKQIAYANHHAKLGPPEPEEGEMP